MSSVAKGFRCFVKVPVAARVKCDPDVVHDGVRKLVGEVESPRLEDTRLASSVDGGSISMPSVTSKAEVMLGARTSLAITETSTTKETMTRFYEHAG